jgi:tetratricopeptide (TPR) repeat protein
MKSILIVFIMLLGFQFSFGQVITDQKEAERIYKESLLESKNNKAYFAEDKRCREFILNEKYIQAEKSCRLATILVEKLPEVRTMERHSAYKTLGVTLLHRQKGEEAIKMLVKSLKVAESNLSEINAETGEVYFFIGQANYLLGEVNLASHFYTKAENTYHFAIKDIDDIEMSYPYFRAIKNILEVHFVVLTNAEMKAEAAEVEKRLTNFKKEFAKYLEN